MSRPYFAPKETYVGTGSVDTYTFDFKITSLLHLLIVVVDDDDVEVERVRGDDVTYLDTVTFDAVLGGGTVVLVADLPASYRIALMLADDEPAQASEFSNKTSFSLKRFESALDVIMGAVQRLVLRANQSFRIHDLDDEETFSTQFPAGIADQGDHILAVNDDGDGFKFGPTVTEVEGWKDDAEAAAAAAAVSESNAASSATASATSATASATSATSSATSATASAASATAAAASAAAAAASVGAFNIVPVQNIASGAKIALNTGDRQWLKVQGNGGPQDVDVLPFSGTPVTGGQITLEGQDNAKILTIAHNDSAGGCINPNAGDIYLGKYATVTYMYDLIADRYKAIAGNGI